MFSVKNKILRWTRRLAWLSPGPTTNEKEVFLILSNRVRHQSIVSLIQFILRLRKFVFGIKNCFKYIFFPIIMCHLVINFCDVANICDLRNMCLNLLSLNMVLLNVK